MHKLEIKLKQHTPLIHFQHDQEGATLRASEVKPKLDKFLIYKLGSENYETIADDDYDKVALIFEKAHPGANFNDLDVETQEQEVGRYLAKKNGWLIGKGEHNALNLKIRIEAGRRVDPIHLNSKIQTNSRNERKYYSYWRENNGRYEDFPLVLSNMGGKDREEDLLNFSFYDSINVVFSSPTQEVIQLASRYIADFFATTNFGQRSSKGFGSFSVKEVNHETIQFRSEAIAGIRRMEFTLRGQIDLEFQNKIFQTIDFYWKCLKSGVNYTRNGQFNDRYIKAFLWSYLDSNGQTWEKRKVKENLHLTTGNERPENPHKATFARALLGCPDKFEYRNFGRTKTVTIKHDENEHNQDYIARIPSSIVFKPIISDRGEDKLVKIYMLIDKLPVKELKRIANRRFKFELEGQSLTLDVDPSVIVFKDLLNKYHQSFKNAAFIKNVFRDNEYDKFVSRYELEDKLWFVPLDFNWRKIINVPVILK